ncbi:MAG TPA: aminotransferase class IV [Dongiaceae bacterium]|nr:aminotransferase class IV [Dongiaceae bacterium]
MIDKVSVNGRITGALEASVSPLDRGFLYGDSVYETLRTYAGRPFRLEPHLDRLRRSAAALGIEPGRAPVDIARNVLDTIAAGRGAAGVEWAIRVILTRGTGALGYDPGACGPPTLVVHVRPMPEIPPSWYREGVDVAIVPVTRNAPAALDPAIKSSNLLNNYLAWEAGRRRGVYEAILLNAAGRIAEGASSNLFVVREGRLATPGLDTGILAGITRAAVLEAARAAGIAADETDLMPAALTGAEEAFLTSTLKGVLPIRRCDGWPIREGRPGPVTRRLIEAYAALVQAETNSGAAPG